MRKLNENQKVALPKSETTDDIKINYKYRTMQNNCEIYIYLFDIDPQIQSPHIRSIFTFSFSLFSVTRRSRSDESHSLTYSLTHSLTHVSATLLTWLWWVRIPTRYLTDVTLVSDDTYRRLNWCDPDDPDESYLVMKVI